MPRGFRYLEHTSDVYIEAYGDTYEEAFEEAGKAVFNIMTNIRDVEPKDEFLINAQGIDMHALLYDWIENLLMIHDIYGYFLSKFKVLKIKKNSAGYTLCAIVWGESANPEKHQFLTYVKSPTYALMEIFEEEKLKKLRFIVDI